MSVLRPVFGRRWRRASAIHGYIGPNGGGKTLAAVWDTLPSLLAGRPVLSTVRLLDFENPRPCDDPACDSPNHGRHMAAHPLWIPWTTWGQLMEVERCDVLADEVTGVASSRDSQSMPSVVANALVQLRRRDVVFRWTAPSWARADLIIRECSQAATLCRGRFSVAVQDEQERAWQHRRGFKWTTWDAVLLDDVSAGKVDKIKPEVVDWHWGPGSPAFLAYDTFDAVSSIGHVSDHGRCMTCGGRRSVAACTCSDYAAQKAERAAGRRKRPAAGSPLAGCGPDDAPAAPDTESDDMPDQGDSSEDGTGSLLAIAEPAR